MWKVRCGHRMAMSEELFATLKCAYSAFCAKCETCVYVDLIAPDGSLVEWWSASEL